MFQRRTLLAQLAGLILTVHPCASLARNGKGPGNDNGVGNDSGRDDNGVGNDEGRDDNGVGNDDGHDDNGVGNDEGGDDNGVGNNDGHDDNGVGNDEDGSDSGASNDDDAKDSVAPEKKRDDAVWSQETVLKERQLGRVIPLKTALRIVNTTVHGRVIDVDVTVRRGQPQYQVKVRRTDGVIGTVRLDARTGKVIGLRDF